MKVIRIEDKLHVTEIRCQMPNCKRHPNLRFLYICDNSLIIGSSCAKKLEGYIPQKHLKTQKTHNNKQKPYILQKSILDLYE